MNIRTMTTHRARTSTLVITLGAVLALSACAGDDWNQGGATTCGTFKGLDSSQQTAVIETFLESKGKGAGGLEVNLTRASAQLYCSTLGGSSDPIRNIDG